MTTAWTALFVGVFIGGILGVALTALMSASSRESERERMEKSYWRGVKDTKDGQPSVWGIRNK